eukprot:COSAG01_NODE_16026_length_1277_cov_1.963497_1_plen_76_part_00
MGVLPWLSASRSQVCLKVSTHRLSAGACMRAAWCSRESNVIASVPEQHAMHAHAAACSAQCVAATALTYSAKKVC